MLSFHRAPVSSPANTFTRGFHVSAIDEATIIQNYVWSPIIFASGHRKQENFRQASYCVLDFDSGELTLGEATDQIFTDYWHIIGTTKSHGIKKNGYACERFRVILRFSRPIYDLRTYRYQMYSMTRSHPCDNACRDGARFFYPCKDIVSTSYHEVDDLAVLEAPEWFDRPVEDQVAPHRRAGIYTSFVRWFLTNAIPEGGRNKAAYGAARELFGLGYSEQDVIALIVRSPTYRGTVDQKLLKEIHDTVKSARRTAIGKPS